MLRAVLLPPGALVAGVFIGAVVTVHHRSLPPLGLILGLVLVAAWGVALRVVDQGRTLAIAGVSGVFIAQITLSAGVGGSYVVLAEPLGYALTLGVVVVSLLVLAWPKLPSPSRYDDTRVIREGDK